MKILMLDIETAPNLAYVWGLFDQNVGLSQIKNSGYVLCWSAKWYQEPKIHFASVQHKTAAGMLKGIHKLLDEADVVVHYNGKSFDIPTLNREFVAHGFTPPSPYKQVDLLQIVRSSFRFVSNKLEYVAPALGIGRKVKHEGFDMWVKCLAGDRQAWRNMEKYNRQDTALLEKLYDVVQPWIRSHPNHATYADAALCPKCGSKDFQARGWAYTTMMRYRRYCCNACRGWFRGNKAAKRAAGEKMMNIGE